MIADNHGHDPAQATPWDRIPEDIELDEAGRNWVHRHRSHPRPLRQMAADAALTSAIGGAYGAG
ncbi:MAG: hypothetical protein ACYCZN_07530 [Candidatus Dormibacteria bacterium]